MSLSDIAIYGGVFAVAIGFWFLLRWSAATFGGSSAGAASADFAVLPGFSPTDVLAYLGSAIGWDEGSVRIAIWEKEGGARLVDPAGVGAWHSGTLVTFVLTRATATPMVQLFAQADDEKPFFKVGVVDAGQCAVWEQRLARAFGEERNREVHVRVLGVN